MDSRILTKYNKAAKICYDVYSMLKKNILENNERNIKKLYDIGMIEISNQCNNIFKKIERKGVAFPISINLNNCIDNFTYDPTNLTLSIQDNDLIHIKLGVDIDGCIAVYGNTFMAFHKSSDDVNNTSENDSDTCSSFDESDKGKKEVDYIKFLNKLKNDILKEMYAGNTNDEVKMMIESKCTENNCFPIPNCKSYQHIHKSNEDDDVLFSMFDENAKYMILNYQKKYDQNEYLIQLNDCFEFLENEVYTINITVIPENENDKEHKILYNQNVSLLYRFNEIYSGLKMKASRIFYSTVFNKHFNNVFNINDYISDIKLKLGVNECRKSGILDEFPVLYVKDNTPVYNVSFTVYIKNKEAVMLKYQ